MGTTRRCMKCCRNLNLNLFDEKPDGSFKSWCIRCCARRGKVLTKMYSRRMAKYGSTKSRKKTKKAYGGNGYSGLCYSTRNLNLKLMGLKTYKHYLYSKMWKSIRVKVFTAKGRICSLCPAKATELHHNRYHIDDLAGRTLEHIHPICNSCHDFIEHGQGNIKRHLHEARSAFNRMKADLLSLAT